MRFCFSHFATGHCDDFNVSLCISPSSSHVQVNNDSAIEFYKGFGFEVVETYPHYYKRIEPADAHVLQKTLKRSTESTEVVTTATKVNGVESK